MRIASYEIPDKCPEDCPFTDDLMHFGQSAICGRCPVLVCTPCDEGWALVEADDYRPDWAKVWHEFFQNGMKEYPALVLPGLGSGRLR